MEPNRRKIFLIVMFFLSIKQGLHIIVGIYKGAPIYGLMFGTALGVLAAWFFYTIINYADKQEKKQIEADIQYQKQIELDREQFLQRRAANRKKEVLKASPWYIGINERND